MPGGRATADGGTPRVGMAAAVYIGDTDAKALDRYRKANGVFVRELTKLWHDNGDHRVDTQFDTDAGLRRGAALVGSPETVRDRLLEQVEGVDINYFQVTLAFGDLTPAESVANLEAFTEVVMPAVRAATTGRPPPDRTSRRAGATSAMTTSRRDLPASR